MADFYSGWVTPPNGGARYRIWLSVTVTSQSIENNTSTLSYALRIQKDRSWNGFFNYTGRSWGANLDGGSEELSGSGTKPDSSWTGTTTWYLGGGTKVVTHDADGTKTDMAVAADYSGPSEGWAPGSMSLSSSMSLPTIPRATTPVLSDATPDTNEAVTVTLTPASAGFSHRLHWAFQPGAGGTAIDNKIVGLAGGGGSAVGSVEGASADGTSGNYWSLPAGTTAPTLTVPHAVFEQSIDQATRTVTLTVETYSGATLIGTKTATMQVTLAASEKPTIGGIANSEATVSPDVATLVGAYVQGVTKLALAVTSPAGIHGSTIVSRTINVAGQTLTADGTTPNVISASGSVAIGATIVDSRGRSSTTFVELVTVLAWAAPQFAASPLVVRATAGGVTDEDEGTYLKVDPADFSASSLVVSAVQKNKIEYRLKYRLVGAPDYTVDGAGWIDPPDTPSVIRFTGTALSTFGSAALGSAYEVLIEIRDVLATTPITRIVPKAAVLMHLKGAVGVGFGGRHSGAANPVEVFGRGKQASDGVNLNNILDLGDAASAAEVGAGSSTTKFVTPASLAIVVADLNALPSAASYREGFRLHVDALNVDFVQRDGVWEQDGVARVASDSSRNTEYAKASGAYLVSGIECLVRSSPNVRYVYLTAAAGGVVADGWFPTAGGVLPFFRQVPSGTQNVSTSNWTLTNAIWGAAEDLTEFTSYASGVLTVKHTGHYQVQATVSFPTGSGAQRGVQIIKNSTSVDTNATIANSFAGSNRGVPAVGAERLEAGDVIRVYTFHTIGSTQAIQTLHGETNWQVHYLGPA